MRRPLSVSASTRPDTRHNRPAGRAASLCAALLLLAAHVSAQTDQRPAGGLEKAPPARDAAVDQRIEWLAGNPEHSAVADVLSGVLNDAKSVAQLTSVSDALSRISIAELRHGGYRAVAAVLRSARMLPEAALNYGMAYLASGGTDLESLYLQAQTLFELGDLAGSSERVHTVLAQTADYELKRRAYTLAAHISYEHGREADARRMLETLASLDDPELVEVESLVLFREILERSGNNEAAARVDDSLARLFPESVAVAQFVAGNRYVRSAGLPSSLLLSAALEAPGDAPAAVGTPAERRDQPRLSAVQVGSFSDPDNAAHLTRDLIRLGLDARTESISREGRTLYQVTVRIADGSTAGAARTLAILRENGFDGFLIY